VREFAAFIEFRRDGCDLALGEIASGIAYHLVLFAERKQGNVWHSTSKGTLFRDYTLAA
jgi:hypothetical protein